MAIDLRTENQKMRDERANEVCKLYKECLADNAGSPSAIMSYIAEEMSKRFKKPISVMGVRYVLINRGLYEPSTR